ncbi:U3 small nucleolar RNA-associated protein 6 like protein [Chelonia mydas]|uniref:U3 small nucleolar RNA-associated protein 6 like protein n=1 Tax=Chelonia mydas TaxID=8469 RepID=M7BSL6_CHEMY|nr:U3 small nucleolar RNA-associated protein 6 like protein [Chelonia mydas]
MGKDPAYAGGLSVRVSHLISAVSRLKAKGHLCPLSLLLVEKYEINLLELIKKRRSRIGYSFKKDEIEYSIVQRIHGLFKRATEKWKDDVQLWLSHVAFCKKWNKKIQLSKVFSAMLAIHPNKPALWIMAAKWEMEERLSSESARHLFLRALRFHPESPKLYQEYFRMELMHAEKQRKEKKEFEQAKMDLGEFSYSEEVLNGEMARIIYRNAVQKIKGAEFYLSLLSIAKLFDFTQDLQKEILENLQAEHADDPLTWDYMARRELEKGSLPSPECSSKQMKASEVAQKEERCCAVFEEAVTALPTEAMWKCYVTFCLERLNRKTNSEELRRKRLERTLSVFSRAHESTLLPETLYKPWLHLLLEVGLSERATEVAAAATKHFSQSVEMWHTRLHVLIKLNSSDVAQCFEEAVRQVKSKGCLPLWTLWVEWGEGASSKEDTEALYQRSLFVTAPADSVTMKEKYLDWAYRDGGYKKAKKVFTRLHQRGAKPSPRQTGKLWEHSLESYEDARGRASGKICFQIHFAANWTLVKNADCVELANVSDRQYQSAEFPELVGCPDFQFVVQDSENKYVPEPSYYVRYFQVHWNSSVVPTRSCY